MFYGMIYMKHIKIEQKVMTVTFCSIVVVNDGKRYFELIDGQQRITTLMILMNVLEKELHSFSNSLNKVYESNNNEILSLRYISWKSYVMTALTSAYSVNYPNKEDLFKVIRRFYYLSLISGSTLNQIKQTSFKLI